MEKIEITIAKNNDCVTIKVGDNVDIHNLNGRDKEVLELCWLYLQFYSRR